MVYRKLPPDFDAAYVKLADLLSDAASHGGVSIPEFVVRMRVARGVDARIAREGFALRARQRSLKRRRGKFVAVAAACSLAFVLGLWTGFRENAPVTAGIAGTSSLAGSAYALAQVSRIARRLNDIQRQMTGRSGTTRRHENEDV